MPMTSSNAKPGKFDVARLPGAFGRPSTSRSEEEARGAGPLREGDTLGDLALERRLGEGGAGEVWLARNQYTGRAFAVKACQAPGSRSLLANEARALGRLMDAARESDFPDSIVRLLETQLASEPPYLVMEFVEGAICAAAFATAGRFRKPTPRRCCGDCWRRSSTRTDSA